MIISIDADKSISQNPTSIHDKDSFNKIVRPETYLNTVRTIYEKPIANSIINGEKQEMFPVKYKARMLTF